MRPELVKILLLSLITLLYLCTAVPAESNDDTLSGLIWVTEEYPPYNFQENGTISGLMVDVVTATARTAGTELLRESIRILPWSEAYQTAVQNPGTVIFSIARIPEREDLFSWVGPVVSSDISLYSSRSRDITINDTWELANYTLGAVTDDIAINFLEEAGIDKETIITDPDPQTLITYLDDGTIDLFAYGSIAAEYHIRNITGKTGYFKVSGRIGSFPVYIGFSKGTSPDLVKQFQHAFDALNKTPENGGMSEFNQILSSWLLEENLMHLQYLTEGYYPYTFVEEGIPKGISVDILQYISSQYGIEIPDEQFIFNSWEDVYNTTLTKNGTAISIIARSDERENLFKWAGPIDKTPVVLFCLQESADTLKNTSPSDMKIGTIIDDIAATALINAGGRDIVYSTEPSEQIRMLETGEIDAWAYASMPGLQRINQYALNPSSIVPIQILDTYDFYIAFNVNTSDHLVQSFQEQLDLIRTEKDKTGVSTYEKILYQYLQPVYSASPITAQDVTDLVNRTVADLAVDTPGTIRKINAGMPPYQSAEIPDLYVFMYDTNVTMIAHADNIRMVGGNYHNKTDVAGTPFRDQIVTGALANGTGWVDYIYSNPVESGLFYKTTHYQLASGSDNNSYVVCAGMFWNIPE
jgi:polar amino acid transport system substrate-binding protein